MACLVALVRIISREQVQNCALPANQSSLQSTLLLALLFDFEEADGALVDFDLEEEEAEDGAFVDLVYENGIQSEPRAVQSARVERDNDHVRLWTVGAFPFASGAGFDDLVRKDKNKDIL